MQSFKHRHTAMGFTLIELILVIMIVSVISVIGAKVLNQAFIGYFDNKYLAEADWQARYALERMQRDIRSIRSPSDITTATASQLTFVNTSGNTISYSLTGTTVMLQYNAASAQVLADGVQSLTFSYYDKNGSTTAVLANIRFITISLAITYNNTNFTATVSVYPRNLP